LRPINKWRLIEAVLVVEVRNDVIAALAHLAGGLGETGLIPIHERDRPGPGDVQKQRAEENENEIADCG
jgi:hypothetical protein